MGREDARHERCLRETMKNTTLLIVHTLGLGFVDLAMQLLAYHHTDGVHTTGPLGGIGAPSVA